MTIEMARDLLDLIKDRAGTWLKSQGFLFWEAILLGNSIDTATTELKYTWEGMRKVLESRGLHLHIGEQNDYFFLFVSDREVKESEINQGGYSLWAVMLSNRTDFSHHTKVNDDVICELVDSVILGLLKPEEIYRPGVTNNDRYLDPDQLDEFHGTMAETLEMIQAENPDFKIIDRTQT